MTRKQAAILITLLLGVFMGALDIFIVAPALSVIQHGLQVSARTITWTFTAYTLVLVVTQPLVAKLSDLYGRRWIYVASVMLFGVGSILCAVAPSFGPFILGRSIQALGAGGVLPVASAVIADTFPESRRGAALGIVGSVFGLAFILGPILGGILTGGVHIGTLVTGWRAIFLVNVPVSLIIIVLAARNLPLVTAHPADRIHFDWYGAALLALALFCLVFGLTQLDFTSLRANFARDASVPFILFGLALFVPFWLNEGRVRDPIVAPRVFSRRQLILAMGLSICAGIVTSSVVYIPQLVQAELRLATPGHSGFYLVWVAVTLTLGTPLTGRLIDRIGSRSVMLFGGLVTAIALIILLLSGSQPVGLVVSLALIGFGLSTFVGTPLRYIVVNEAPPDRRASSLSVLTVCNSIGQTLILPLGGALIASETGTNTVLTATQRLATIQAIHVFYLIVLALIIGGILLTLNLKTHAVERADRRLRERVARRHSRPRTAAATPGEAVMSTR